ncbi:MAG: GTPase HflX, partial [Xanthomonadales bacterium]|nr:GTPase HflX [Xanthomonadales bacterium]
GQGTDQEVINDALQAAWRPDYVGLHLKSHPSGITQLETDRRLIGARIRQLRERLDKVAIQRNQSRRQRVRSRAPLVALVGYTNAGKSTLFNALTGATVGAQDRLFATLDPTVRSIEDMHCGEVLLADTVGFVSDLPHELIAAFRSTLQEAREADLLIHVVDASDPYHAERQQDVEGVLESIGAENIPILRVFNKIDRTGQKAKLCSDAEGNPRSIRISARRGEGIEELREAISQVLSSDRINRWIELGGPDAKLRAQLFELGVVSEERIAANGSWMLHVDVPMETAERLARLPGSEGELVRNKLLATAEAGA